MRFLVGLISGAALMLVLAQLLAAPDGRWRERAMAMLDTAVSAGRQAMSAAPEESPEPAGTVATTDAAAPAEEAAAGPEEPARQPIPRPPDPLPLVSEEDTQRIVEEVFESTRPSPAPPAQELAGTHSQVVWAPFRSEMSANGFAERLSAALDHSFDVERRGPGRYEVVFDYRNEPEREAVLSEAAQVTGLPL